MQHFFFMALSLLLVTSSIHADPPTLKDHMRAMGYIIDEINARSTEPKSFKEAASKTRELRSHLVQAIALEPGKFATFKENELNAARREYHQALARVIYLSASLERVLETETDFETQSGSRVADIRNILHEMNVLVGKAHAKFRD